MRFLGLALVWSVLVCGAYAQRTTQGTIYDAEENPIPNVKIEQPNSSNVVYSDDNGHFLLSYFADDSRLIFSHDGYDSLQMPLKFNKDTKVFLNAIDGSNDYHLGYRVGFLDFKNKNKNKNLQNMPYFLGESDINRQLQMLPGIEQGSEGYSNLFVRGGDVDQNLMLYNGTPIYNSNHLFGLSSTFHNRSIDNTAIYRGIAPARYGGRSSSVISLESKKTGDFSGLVGEFEMTPLNAGVYFENIKKDKSYFTMAARRSWIDLLVPVESKQNTANANIYDLQLNFGKKLENDDKIDVSVMNTRDLYYQVFTSLDSNASTSSSYGFTQTWSNLLASVKYTQNYSKKISAEHSVYYSGYKSIIKLQQEIFDYTIQTLPTTEQKLTRGIRDIGIQSNWNHFLNNRNTLSYGIQSSTKLFLTSKYEYTATDYPNLADVSTTEGDQKYSAGNEISLYAEDRYRMNDNVVLDVGMRNTIYNYDGYTKAAIEPKIHLTSFLKNSDVLKLAYNRHNQFVNQLNLGETGSPSNIWVPATALILPQVTNFLEAGYEKKLGSQYSGSVNVYLKSMKNLSQVSDLGDAGDPGSDWQGAVVQGTGESYGLELLLQKSKGYFTGWLSYTYSQSTRNFEDLYQEDFLFTFDRPHMLKVYANFTRESSDWNIGVNYLIGSGQLFTLPIGKYRDIDGNLQLEYNTLNNYRSPLYQRVDLSLVRLRDAYGLGQEWRFYVYNAFGNRNPMNVFAEFENSSYTQLNVNRNYLAFVPGIAYVVKF
ncbi:TonB-dependent receptor [Bacteroidia bacterium]|nr:TonB-dependent receptor [Bacteroidia bacterium]